MDFIQSVDNAVVDFMLGLQNQFLTGFFTFFTVISEKGILWIAIAILLLINKKTRKIGAVYSLSLAIGFGLSELLIKDLVMRERPFIANGDIKLLISAPSGYSFPSSHSASSFASAVSLFLCDRRMGRSALVMAFLIALSRIYFTVHYLTDVLGGITLGTVSAILIYLIIKKATSRDKAEA